VLEALEQLRTDAAKHVDAALWSLSDAELSACLDTLHQLEQTVAALRSHVVRQIDARGVAAANGFRHTAGWLRDRLRLDPIAARDMVDQAAALDRRPNLDRALAAGAIDGRQATVIADTLAALPAGIDLAVIADAEATLLDLAAQFPPGQLRRLGTRILDHVAPEVADEADRTALALAEQRALRRRALTLSVPVDGSVRVSGHLTVEDAAIITAALDPLCAPRPADDRTAGQRRADALVDICQLALRTGSLPDHGGEPAQVVVTVPYDVLTGELRRGVLDSGPRVSPDAVRRLACDAQVLPAVLGGAGQPLDIGRSRRLFTGPIRRALVLRDRGCAFPHCDRPARWCDAHHMVSWLHGGPTNLANGVLLCRRHHRIIHGGEWTVRLGADELPEFIPPAHIDPARRPRRNLYHRRT
jgi:Domain of unknown function (DUF222)